MILMLVITVMRMVTGVLLRSPFVTVILLKRMM